MLNDRERLTPHTYEDYEIIDDLTTGELGRVYVVRLKALPNKLWIMKRLRYLKEKDKRIADEEVEMLKLAGSKYTVRLVEKFTFDVDLCVVMEYCEGGNLRELIKKMKTQTIKKRKEQSYYIFYQVLMGLKHFHSLSDLKPENIFLDQDGNVKIGSFGLALKIESKSQVNAAGIQNQQPSEALNFNQYYLPPEAHEQKQLTETSDIWALGAIVTELLTGVHPFQGRTLDETILNIKNGRFKALPDFVKGELKEMLISMINIDPLKRPSTEELLDSDLMILIAKIENEKEQSQKVQTLEQQKNDAIEKTRIAENQVLQLEQQNNELQLPCSVLKQIGEDLKKLLQGTDEEKKQLLEVQETDCKLIQRAFYGKKDDIGRKRIIQSGVIEGFNNVFENYDLNLITRTYSQAFFNIANNSNNEIIHLINNKKPYPGLIRLHEHTDKEIACDAIVSILLILQAGADSTSKSDPHPHYESVQQCDGIKKIFAQFKKNENKYSRDRSALCIGFLFKAREITDQTMRKEIIGHLKILLSGSDAWVKKRAKDALQNLAQNDANRSEILNEDELKRIEQDLKQQIEGTNEQQKSILQRQETDLVLLSTILQGRNDDELRKRIISSGIVENILFIFTNRDFNSITRTYSQTFFQLTNPAGDEIRLLLIEKKPYPGLIRLHEHTDNLLAGDAIASIMNILSIGRSTTPNSEPHPHFEAIQECGGINKIFELFHRADASKDIKDRSCICLGRIFHAQEITDTAMRHAIISHLKTLINDSDTWTKNNAKLRLKGLALNTVNKAEIEAGGFTIPE
ncbi:MAG: putative NEK/NEK2 protein kinase [Streblomastix strix]|uniref:non-specific serine/threonine protein kinase n=1 Tax=Streblomastix strix TaxID=222440 RepID=A0A5J4X9C0_9EUKA|nr:MAG: putative NEK/NEK2 protein kinase [Streblomastix strix]